MAFIPQEHAKLKGHNNLQKENVSNIRSKATTIPQDGLVKRRHLSVLDNNEQVRKVSVDCEGAEAKCKSGNSVKSEVNESTHQVIQKDQCRRGKGKDLEAKQEKDNVSEKTVTNKTLKSSSFWSTQVSPNLPLGVINIDLNDEICDYGGEIVVHLKNREKDLTLHESFFDQNSVTETMRSVLVDWLIQVQHHLKFSQECLYLTIAMLDNILDKRDIDPDKLQLVGVTSLWISSKVEEYYPAELSKLIHLTENSYKRYHIVQMEKIMLRILNFNVYFPEPMVFLLRFSRAALRSSDSMFLETCQYLIDSFIIHKEFSSTRPSRLAAGAVLATSHLYSALVDAHTETPPSCWTPTLVHYSGYSKEEVEPVALSMLREVFKAATDEDYKYKGAHTKYKSQSQHNRLVLQAHLAPKVISKARQNLGDDF